MFVTGEMCGLVEKSSVKERNAGWESKSTFYGRWPWGNNSGSLDVRAVGLGRTAVGSVRSHNCNYAWLVITCRTYNIIIVSC